MGCHFPQSYSIKVIIESQCLLCRLLHFLDDTENNTTQKLLRKQGTTKLTLKGNEIMKKLLKISCLEYQTRRSAPMTSGS